MKKLTIAIDGPSAAGKSTIAKMLAQKLGYTYIDTGAMYRCVAYYCLQQGIDLDDQERVESSLEQIEIELKANNQVFLNKQDVTKDIRTDQISLAASKISSYNKVRSFLVASQQKMAQAGGVIMDGRDVGTVVLPRADLKIYQIASVETRAKRRYLENIARGMTTSLEMITNDLKQRDYQDQHRKISPLVKADDAVEIDTSDLSLEEVVAVIMKLIDERRN